jgi:hypothetical protein
MQYRNIKEIQKSRCHHLRYGGILLKKTLGTKRNFTKLTKYIHAQNIKILIFEYTFFVLGLISNR